LFLIGCDVVDRIPHARARPPQTVTNIPSCLTWLQKPRGVYRLITDGAVYYQITGPSGSYWASGPSAYTFDVQGRFIDWSPDIGDRMIPPQVFSPGAKREKITLEELGRSF